MSHPPFLHIRGANKCAQSFVILSQCRLKRTQFGLEKIDVKMSKWTSIPRSIAKLLSGWTQSSCSFPDGFSAGMLKSFLGWGFRAFSGCSARSSTWGNFSRACWIDQSCVLSWGLLFLQDEPHSFFTACNNLDPAVQSSTPYLHPWIVIRDAQWVQLKVDVVTCYTRMWIFPPSGLFWGYLELCLCQVPKPPYISSTVQHL